MLIIQKTKNYSQFKFLNRNRPILPDYLVESISKKNMLKEHPIICDEEMYVIDGQHRLKAAEILDLDIYYIVSKDISENDVGLCQSQKPWVVQDFLKFYSEINEDYNFVKKVQLKFNFPLHFIISCCNSKSNVFKDFRKGTFKLSKNKDLIEKKIIELKEIIDLIVGIKRNHGFQKTIITSRFYRALWGFINKENYNQKNMLHALNTYPSNIIPILNFNLESCISDALRDRIYNYKKKEYLI